MDENKKIREVKVVGYSRELLFLQLTILVCVFSLLGISVSSGWWKMLSVAFFLCLCGFSLFQVSRLRRRGVTISICDLNAAGDAPVCDEECPGDFTEEIETDENLDIDEDHDALEQPHWTESLYPDPDVELGLKNSSPAEDEQSVINGISDTGAKVVQDETPQ